MITDPISFGRAKYKHRYELLTRQMLSRYDVAAKKTITTLITPSKASLKGKRLLSSLTFG